MSQHHGHDHDHDHHGHDHHGHDHHGHDHHGHDHHHDHGGHGHGHGPHIHVAPGADPRRALLIALILNGGFLLVEAGVGWWSGSLALLSDAAHMTSDVASLAMALGAAQLARRAASSTMTFGLHRTETLGAFVNGLALYGAVGWIVWEALHRLTGDAHAVPAGPVLLVGAVGLAINLGSAWALYRSDRDNLNVRGALAHMLADALGSVGAVVAALCLAAGYPSADALISLVIAALVAWGATRVTLDASRVLLQLPPSWLDVDALLVALTELEGVQAVHDVHVWTLDGHRPIVTAHLVAPSGHAPQDLVDLANRTLRDRFGIEHATFQVEPEDRSPCPHLHCGVGPMSA